MPRWLKEMKESRAKFFVVVFLSSFDVTFPESLQINRIISQPKDQQTWKKVSDLFVVPSSTCYQGRIGTGGNSAATNHVQKMTRKNSIRVTVPINLPLSRTWITHGYVWRIRWCEINSVSLINIGVWESMLRNPNDKQIHDTFQLLIPCDLTFYGNVIEVILGLQFAVYETFDWALSFSGVLRDKLK